MNALLLVCPGPEQQLKKLALKIRYLLEEAALGKANMHVFTTLLDPHAYGSAVTLADELGVKPINLKSLLPNSCLVTEIKRDLRDFLDTHVGKENVVILVPCAGYIDPITYDGSISPLITKWIKDVGPAEAICFSSAGFRRSRDVLISVAA
jgi:hypothetical protein